MSAKAPELTETVACCTSTLLIYGRRCGKGWKLSRRINPVTDPAVIAPCIKGKEVAVRTALDCCAEELNATFILKPATA